MVANPFKPSAGAEPPVLVGRGALLDDFKDALAEGPGSPGRISIFTGARGAGKTVMLSEVEDLALRAGWLTVSETATAGLVGRLEHQLQRLEEDRRPRPRRRVTSVGLPGGFSVGANVTPELSVALRERVGRVLDLVPAGGLLVTIDEVHGGVREELREVAAITQHLVREGREFALVMAGLPTAVSDLLSDDVLTFLRRADKHLLADVDIDEVRDAFIETIESSGRAISESALAMAAEATGGYPFLIQLVGYHVWKAAGKRSRIEEGDAIFGVDAARRRMGELVHATALNDLSDKDRVFLGAMSADAGPSRVRDLVERMDVSPQYVNQYRRRLLEAGMIVQPTRGQVDFALPYLREYLREQGARR